jgi:hypothetical protein
VLSAGYRIIHLQSPGSSVAMHYVIMFIVVENTDLTTLKTSNQLEPSKMQSLPAWPTISRFIHSKYTFTYFTLPYS